MADVVLEITIPEAYIARAVTYLEKLPGANMRLEIEKYNPSSDYMRADGSLRQPLPEQGTDTTKEYAERISCRLWLMVFDAIDKYIDEKDRYKPAIAAIPSPTSDVPEDMLE